jgi:hypothetical protein
VGKPRRVIRVLNRPGKFVSQGLTSYRGRPCAILESTERALIHIDFDMAIPADEQIVSLKLGSRGVTAKARFTERAAEIGVSGARPVWYNYGGYDYGLDAMDTVDVSARMSHGDDITIRLYVRGPNKPQEWHATGGSDHNVVDARAAGSIYGDGPTFQPFNLNDMADGGHVHEKVYTHSDFADFGEEFGT